MVEYFHKTLGEILVKTVQKLFTISNQPAIFHIIIESGLLHL